MSVRLTRVDYRMIHGQVITRWIKQCDINEIDAIDTALSNDEFMHEVFKKAVNNAITLNLEDGQKLKEMEQKGIHIYLQTTPDYPSIELDEALKKL